MLTQSIASFRQGSTYGNMMLLKLLYYVTQFYGLSPFKFHQSSNNPTVLASKCFTFTNLISGSFLCIFTVVLQMYYILFWRPERAKLVLLVTMFVDCALAIGQNVLIFSIQFINRNELVKFINEAVNLKIELQKMCPNEVIVSPQFRRAIRSKMLWKCFQIAWLTVATLTYQIIDNNPFEWIFAAILIFIYLYPVMMTTPYYCGSVLIAVRYYEILNTKMVSVMDGESPKSFRDVCDDIDSITLLYDRIAGFVELINRHLSLQILIMQISSFAVTIFSVKFHFPSVS